MSSSSDSSPFSFAPPSTSTNNAGNVFGQTSSPMKTFGASTSPKSGSSGFGSSSGFSFGSALMDKGVGKGGFGALAASASSAKAFGSPSTSSSIFESGKSNKLSSFSPLKSKEMVKSHTTDEEENETNEDNTKACAKNKGEVEKPENVKVQNENNINKQKSLVIPDNKFARNAAKVFDGIDTKCDGSISISNFENLLDELGEGFHGEEMKKQIALVDPTGSNLIERSSFIIWYCNLVDDENDIDSSSSLDTEEREDREEERKKAEKAFDEVSTDGGIFINTKKFGDLMEAMGTTYCEEEHRRTIKKLSIEGKISKASFITWYIDWLFGEGDESDEYDDENEDSVSINRNEIKDKIKVTANWGDCFKNDANTWKCNECMVSNKEDLHKCAACEAVRPGYEDKVSKDTGTGNSSFTFGGGKSGASSSPTPFSFGASNTEQSSSKTGGFSFGTQGNDNKASPFNQKISFGSSDGSFSFGGVSVQSSTSGFKFGIGKLSI